jgi:hypothetical protein
VTALRIFACFDSGHDADLHAHFAKQCVAPGSTLSVEDWSREEVPHAGWEDKLRGRMEDVDAVVVICGEHTIAASNVNREFSIVQEQGKPYVLLYGRRSATCTKPVAAKPNDHFYTWIWDVLTSQIDAAVRTRSSVDPVAVEPRGLGRR